jgi:hypothetical protein
VDRGMFAMTVERISPVEMPSPEDAHPAMGMRDRPAIARARRRERLITP